MVSKLKSIYFLTKKVYNIINYYTAMIQEEYLFLYFREKWFGETFYIEIKKDTYQLP